MLNSHLFRATLIGTLLTSAAPAFADLSPQEALNRYFELNTSMGMNMTVGDKSQNGDTIRWSDITLSDPEGKAKTVLDWIEASPESANTVLILSGPNAQTTIEETGEDFTLVMNTELQNVLTRVTEDGDILSFSLSGDRMNITTEKSSSSAPFSMNVSVDNLTGAYAMTADDRIDGTFATGAMKISYGIDDDEVQMSSDSTIGGLEAAFGIDLVSPEMMTGYLDGSKNMNVRYSFNDTKTVASFGGPDGSGQFASNVDTTTANIGIKDGTITANGVAENITYQVMAMELGMPPIDAKIGSVDMDILLKIGKAGEVAPMDLALGINALEINEALWGMFDPAGEIPREPATINLDLGAEALWLLDDFNAAMESGQPPVIPQTMDLRNLFISLGGASLQASGSGSMSMETGTPSGEATVEAKGLLQLVQTLASIGIIPPQQAMMAQAMAPQFARQGAGGADHLISDIVTGPDGSVTVNGNRVK